MATLEEYAVLSARVYWDARRGDNIIPVPPGWVEITYSSDMENNPFTSGYSGGAYQNLATGEIVIAFKGTDFLIGQNNGQTAADLVADLGLATGLGSSQLREAALFYAQIKAANPDATITFTGHSLGGGLASIMAVWFDRPAVVFAEAPFELSAGNGGWAGVALDALHAMGFYDPAFESLVSLPDSDIPTYVVDTSLIAAREANVTNYYVQGEVLNKYLSSRYLSVPILVASDNPIVIGGGDQVSSIDLHSIVLHAALELDNAFGDAFGTATLVQPNLLSLIFDKTLYARDAYLDEQDFLTKLVNEQISYMNGNPSAGMLSRFADDIAKLGDAGTVKYDPLNRAILSAAIEGYYFMPSNYTQPFINSVAGGIEFDLHDIGSNWQQIGWQRLVDATGQLVQPYLLRRTKPAHLKENQTVTGYQIGDFT